MPHPSPDAHSPAAAHVLLAHGSRDPQWPAALEIVASRIRQIDPAARVCCAYLESARPDLATAIDQLIAGGAQTVAVWPMFIGLGRHARADLPRLAAAAQARHPGVTITLQSAIAEHAPVRDAMAQVILR